MWVGVATGHYYHYDRARSQEMGEGSAGYRRDTQDPLWASTWSSQINTKYITPNAKIQIFHPKYRIGHPKYKTHNTKQQIHCPKYKIQSSSRGAGQVQTDSSKCSQMNLGISKCWIIQRHLSRSKYPDFQNSLLDLDWSQNCWLHCSSICDMYWIVNMVVGILNQRDNL